MANKVYTDAKSALEGVLKDGQMLMCGGFGLVGVPDRLIAAVRDSGVKGLTCVSNNAGIDGAGLGLVELCRVLVEVGRTVAPVPLAAPPPYVGASRAA